MVLELMTNLPRVLWYLREGLNRLHWDKHRLQAYQEKRLRSIVKHAYETVPFYRDQFKKIGVSPDDIKTLDDLSKLPIIRKDVIRKEDPKRLISLGTDMSKLKELHTTGSTGNPFRVFLAHAEDDWRKAIFMRANISCGQKARNKWVVVTLPRHYAETTRIQRKLGVFAQTIVSLFDDVSEQVRLVEQARPDVLDGYSNWLHLMAKVVQSKDIETIRPRIMFGTAELVDNAKVQFMEKVFQAPYYDQYGCIEIDRAAWQCPQKVGYHMDVDSVISEFVDEEGDVVSSNERGEILFTSLFSYSMPFIRYAIGDVGVPSNEICPCGRVLPLMKLLEGRTDSMLRLPNGVILSPVVFIGAMESFGLINHVEQYKLVQRKVNQLTLYIQQKPHSPDEKTFREAAIKHFSKCLNIDPDEVNVEVEFLENIDITIGGKHRAIVSEVST